MTISDFDYAYNSEMWTDTDAVDSAFRRNNETSLTVRLMDAGAFGAFKAQAAGDPRLKLNALTIRGFQRRGPRFQESDP